MQYHVEGLWSSEYGDVESIDDFCVSAQSDEEALGLVEGELISNYPEVGGHCDGIGINVYCGDDFVRSGHFEWGHVDWDDDDEPRSLCVF